MNCSSRKRSTRAHELLAELGLALVVELDRVVVQLAGRAPRGRCCVGAEILAVDDRTREDVLERVEQAVEVPVLDEVAGRELVDECAR